MQATFRLPLLLIMSTSINHTATEICTQSRYGIGAYRLLKAGVACVALLLTQCASDAEPANPYAITIPDNFPASSYTFQNNPVTPDGFELGRALFYDPVMSSDSSVACANCHQQARAFADPVHRLSRGVNEAEGIRNAPAIQNMAFQEHFFWDGGVNHLDFVPINAITNPVEMNESVAHVVSKLNRSTYYPQRFEKAFGSTEITSQRMLYALSQFMARMISANAHYDHWIRDEGESLSADALAGYSLFQTNCSPCHATDLFTDGSFRNNGLDVSFEKDEGRKRISEADEDSGKFKVPSLRNVALTPPYMHDGRFKTLSDVLNHYSSGVHDSPTLDPLLKKDSTLGIPLSEKEKADLIEFLKTLTDDAFVHDPLFTNPFVR